jgi:hypothetical protein
MTRVPRQHGTLAMRCRGECRTDPCDACLDAGRRYARRNRKQRRMGTVPLVDAGRARGHVQHLLEEGMLLVQIQNLSGVDRTAIRCLLGTFPNRKQTVRIRSATEAALLRVQVDRGSAIDGLTPAIGTRRRIQALQAIGYPRRYLAARLGMSGLQFGKSSEVRAVHARAVAELYRELSDTPGPSSKIRAIALNRGYLPPVWWDDDTIDDPRAEPEGLREYREVRRQRRIGGRREYITDVELVDDVSAPRAERVALMHRRGLSVEQIAARLNTRARARYVRHDLAEDLAEDGAA